MELATILLPPGLTEGQIGDICGLLMDEAVPHYGMEIADGGTRITIAAADTERAAALALPEGSEIVPA